MGITIIHERKKVLRQIKELKNLPVNSNSFIIVKYFDSMTQNEKSIKFKITESKIKIKHILQQAFQVFKQKKCDLSQHCLIQKGSKDFTALLPNNALIHDLITPYKIEEFQICDTQHFAKSQASLDTRSTCSPIRTLRPDIESSLDRLVNSPTQTIYVQPIDDQDDMLQLNQSNSECPMQLNTYRQSARNQSKSSGKHSNKSNLKLLKKSKLMQQSLNSNLMKEQGINQSTANYLQNYITSNRQSHKKQPSSSSNILPVTNFQMKKHSVNETAFNYQGQNNIGQQTQIGTASTNSNTGGVNSLSRGNSMKKMKTFCNGQNPHMNGIHNQTVQNFKFNNTGSQGQQNGNQISFQAKQAKKILHKGQKSVNMYSTLNGQPSHLNNLTKRSQAQNKENIKSQASTQSEYVKIHNENQDKQKKSDQVVSQSRTKDHKITQNQQKIGQMKQSFMSNQEQALLFPKQSSNEKHKINNLNDIFSDFLDEQTQNQTAVKQKQKLHSRVRAESLHSRQQVLLEEDSLESTKRYPEQYQVYMQTEQNQNNCYDSSNQYQNNYQQQQQQRSVKHMAHKSMYALNSNQSKQHQQKKSISGVSNNHISNDQQLNHHFGTFDNSQLGIFQNNNFHQYAVTSMSDIDDTPQQYQILQDNQNIINNVERCNSLTQQQIKHNQDNSRLNTEIDIGNKENFNFQKETFEGLGKRGGTLGALGYGGRSNSNTNKHRNNRYSDQCDDLLMMDMSEEESVIINRKH